MELLEALNDKVTNQGEKLIDTRNTIFKKVSILERTILERLSGGASGSQNVAFSAYEDTIDKLQQEIEALQKDFLLHREKTASEVKQGLEVQKRTREDYVKRIKEIYDDQGRVVSDIQSVMNQF